METCQDTNVSPAVTPPILPSYCLICGDLLNKVIKHEQDYMNCENEERDIVTLIHESSPWSEMECRVFQQLLKWFKVKLGRKTFWNKESEYFPFCRDCKGKLAILLEIQQKLDELTKTLKDGVQEVRNKMESCEEVFVGNNIYDKDKRYHEIRRQLVKVSAKPNKHQLRPARKVKTQLEIDPEPTPTNSYAIIPESNSGEGISRKSTRLRKSVMRMKRNYDLGDEDDNEQKSTPSAPIVLLSVTDKINAEKHIHQSFTIKGGPDEGNKPLPRNAKSKSTLHTSETTSISYAEYSDDWEDDMTTDPPEIDNDFVVKPGPISRKLRGSSLKKRHNRKRKDEDMDFVMCEDSLSEQSEDDDEINDNILDNDDARKREGYERVIFDASNETFSCMNFVFDKIPGENEQYSCRKCEKVFNFEKGDKLYKKRCSIKNHVIKEHTDRFVCKECGLHESGRSALNMHIRYKHEGVFSSQYQFYKKQTDRSCPVCEKPGITKNGMKTHLWTHKSKVERDEALSRGEKDPTYRPSRKFQCEKCGKNFTTHAEWKRHTVISHQTEEEKEKRKELCTECGKVTLDLKNHMLTNHNNRKIICCLCNKTFTRWIHLKRHKKAMHTNHMFSCTLCPRTFARTKILDDHMKLHLNIRDFKCEHCPAAFHKKGTLVRHMNTFHVEGAKVPKRKSYQRGPTQLGVGQRKDELVKTNAYCPPSYRSWWKPKPEAPSNSEELDGQDLSTN